MDFGAYLSKVAQETDREVEKILKGQLYEAKKIDEKLVPLFRTFIKSCQGGKRIRAALIKLGFEIAGGKSKEITTIGAAYEILHTAVLAHDDIIDQDTLRREKPSLYQALGGNHYGVSQAISLADFGFFLSFKIFANTKAASIFSEIMLDTAFGQMLDVLGDHSLAMMKLKTARYTIAGPFMIGAVLGGADQKLIRALEHFGENLGIAYQIRDDILDSEAGGINNPAEYINKAMKMIPEITKDRKMSKLLDQMAEYLVRRTK